MQIEHYNCLTEILELIRFISKDIQPEQIVWGGNARHVPLINEALKVVDIHIDYVIDNDSEKWGKEVAEVNYSHYYEMVFPISSRRKVYIYSPNQIVDCQKKQVFIIASRYADEIEEQLLTMGVQKEYIYTFKTNVINGIKRKNGINAYLEKCKRLELREMQLLELEILKAFDVFCQNNNLRYYLSSGSLLGAVRHGGFIPWDDDIDVYMPYEDYLEFMKKYPIGGRYEAVDWKKYESYYLPFGKLIDTKTLLLHPGYPVQGVMGVYIDIFPLAGYKETCIEEFWKKNIILEQDWNDFYTCRDILGKNIYDIRHEVIRERYEYSFYESEIVGARHFLPYVKQWCISKKVYLDVTKVLFEGEYFDAPIDYDGLLKVRYGNYMEIPPKEKQVAHSFFAYMRN